MLRSDNTEHWTDAAPEAPKPKPATIKRPAAVKPQFAPTKRVKVDFYHAVRVATFNELHERGGTHVNTDNERSARVEPDSGQSVRGSDRRHRGGKRPVHEGISWHEWTDEELDRLTALRKEGVTYTQIAPQVGHSVYACQRMGQKLKLPQKYSPWNDSEVSAVARMSRQGYTSGEIAMKLNRTKDSVTGKINELRRKGVL